MFLISGTDALVARTDPNRYQEAVYFLAKTVERVLSLAYFYDRLTDQIGRGTLSGIDAEQARYSQLAFHNMAIVEQHKLVDNRKDSWSLRQLFTEWKLLEPNKEIQIRASGAIADLEEKLKLGGFTNYRHENLAHQSKRISMTDLTVLPMRIPLLEEVVETLDFFVTSPIHYILYVYDTSEELNLRELLELG